MVNNNLFANKTATKIFIAALTLLVVFAVSFASFYYFTNRININYLSSINKVKSQIEEENNNATKILNNLSSLGIEDQESINQIVLQMKSIEQSFDQIQSNINNIAPPEKYINYHKQLYDAVLVNKKIITQARLILSNLKSKNIPKALEDFNLYIKEAQSKYSNLKIINIKLSNDFYVFPDTLKTFAYKYYEAFDRKNRLYEQYQNYFFQMDEIIKQFIDAKINLYTFIEKLKNNQTTIENINIEIEKKLIVLEDIENTYLNTAAPEKVVITHSKLDSIFENYKKYCKEFKDNLKQLEIAGAEEEALLEVSQKFEELDKSYSQLTEDWMKFLDEYNTIKDEYSDLKNI